MVAGSLVAGARGNYFERFDLVPATLLPYLGQGRVLITNWHTLAVRDDGGKRQVMQRGQESPTAFANGVPQNEEYVDIYGIPFEVIPTKPTWTPSRC